MIITGPNGHRDFMIGARTRDGVVINADRAVQFLRGRPITDVVDLARWRGWRVELKR